jgi:hypothetical protein
VARKIPGVRLVSNTPKSSETQQFSIRQRQTTIGSDESNDFVICDSGASRRHASRPPLDPLRGQRFQPLANVAGTNCDRDRFAQTPSPVRCLLI